MLLRQRTARRGRRSASLRSAASWGVSPPSGSSSRSDHRRPVALLPAEPVDGGVGGQAVEPRGEAAVALGSRAGPAMRRETPPGSRRPARVAAAHPQRQTVRRLLIRLPPAGGRPPDRPVRRGGCPLHPSSQIPLHTRRHPVHILQRVHADDLLLIIIGVADALEIPAKLLAGLQHGDMLPLSATDSST